MEITGHHIASRAIVRHTVPSDSHLLGTLKKYLDYKRFAVDAEVKKAVTCYLLAIDTLHQVLLC